MLFLLKEIYFFYSNTRNKIKLGDSDANATGSGDDGRVQKTSHPNKFQGLEGSLPLTCTIRIIEFLLLFKSADLLSCDF
jgi:hypothetical protein